MRRWLASEASLAVVLVAYALLFAALAVVLAVLFARVDSAVNGIQQSRLDLCEQQNARHDKTLRILDREIARLPRRARARATRERAGTVALIDALSPRRDCLRVIPPPP